MHCCVCRSALWLLVALIVTSGSSCNRSIQGLSGAAGGSHPLVGQAAPEVSGTTLGGEPFSMKEAGKGQIVLLDFWATWCGPCVVELPILVRVAQEFRKEGVHLYAVNCGEGPQEIQEFLSDKNWDLDVVLDPGGEAARQYLVEAIPQLVVIDHRGIVHSVSVGFTQGLESELRRQLRSLVDAQAREVASRGEA